MGFLDDITRNVKSDLSWKAARGASEGVSKGVSKVFQGNKKTKCPKCRKDISPEEKFCQNCGEKLVLTCPKCSAEFPAGTKFCAKCGSPLN